MNTPADASGGSANAFLTAFIRREGGLAEVDPDGAVEGLLTPALQAATGLPESAHVRILGVAGAGEQHLALESAGLRWCLERAAGRGRRAAAGLAPPPASRAVVASAARKVQALNGSLRAVGTRGLRLRALILEFRCEAVSEERLDLREFVAVEPDLELVSAAWASALLDHLPEATPAATEIASSAIQRAAKLAGPHARARLAGRIESLRERLGTRMALDAARLVEYHQALLDETRRRQGGTDAQALARKRAAIAQQRDQKLTELAERLAIEARVQVASAIGIDYSASACDLVLLRRKREIPLTIPWDPFLRSHLSRACRACSQPTLAFHACDAEGHLTCAACAKPCVTCSRVTCGACEPGGCRGCLRAAPRRG